MKKELFKVITTITITKTLFPAQGKKYWPVNQTTQCIKCLLHENLRQILTMLVTTLQLLSMTSKSKFCVDKDATLIHQHKQCKRFRIEKNKKEQ